MCQPLSIFLHNWVSWATVWGMCGREKVGATGRTRGGDEGWRSCVCACSGGEGESRFGKKSSSDGNYQSLRNAAAARTRQAAAWLQQCASLLYPIPHRLSHIHTHTHTHWTSRTSGNLGELCFLFVSLMPCSVSCVYFYHSLPTWCFTGTVSFLQQTKGPHNVSEGLSFSPSPLSLYVDADMLVGNRTARNFWTPRTFVLYAQRKEANFLYGGKSYIKLAFQFIYL